MENISTLHENDKGDFLFYLILVLAILLGSMLGTGVVVGVGAANGVQLDQMIANIDGDSPLGMRNFVRVANGISHFFTFSLAAIVFAIYFFGRSWWSKLGLHRFPSGQQLFTGILFILLSFPFIQLLYWLNRQLPLPEFMTQMEDSAEQMLEAILNMQGPGEIFLNLLIIALLPAIGEELLFRGLLQTRIERYFKNAVPAIWITAVVFSAFHLQFEGFFPRFLLGAMLGYLFYWSRSLWLPIIAHLAFNGSQVIAQYFLPEQMEQLEQAESVSPDWLMGIGSLVLVLGIGFFISRTKRNLSL